MAKLTHGARKEKAKRCLEIWKEHPVYSRYEISNQGNVRRSMMNGKRINRSIKIYIDPHGYANFYPSVNGKVYSVKLHQAVLETFVGGRPTPKHGTNHKNGVKSDNRLENLEWSTQSENMQHAYDTGLFICPVRKGIKNGRAKLTEHDVKKIRRLRKEGHTLQDIASKFGVAFSLIHRITRLEAWSHVKD